MIWTLTSAMQVQCSTSCAIRPTARIFNFFSICSSNTWLSCIKIIYIVVIILYFMSRMAAMGWRVPTIQVVTEYNKLIGQVKNPSWQEAISLSRQYEWYFFLFCFFFLLTVATVCCSCFLLSYCKPSSQGIPIEICCSQHWCFQFRHCLIPM